MCFNIGGEGSYSSSATSASKKENKDTNKIAKAQRLLETKGLGDGEKVTGGKSVKRIFGN